MRIGIFIIALVINIYMVGCSKNVESINKYIEGQDAKYMYMMGERDRYITASDEGYYFVNGLYLYFCDYDSMESTVLCNRVECLHDKEMDSTKKMNCNGFINDGSSPKLLTVYDGHIYYYIENDFFKDYSSGAELIRISLDGTQRKTVCKLEENIMSMALHRGKLYYSVENVKDENNGLYECYIKEYDISKLNSKFKEILKYEGVMASIQEIIPIGNKLIYTKFSGDNNELKYGYYVYDLSSKLEYKVGEEVTDENLGIVSIFNKMIMFIPRIIKDDEVILDSNIYINDLNSKESKVLFQRTFEEIVYYSDDNYIYSDNVASLNNDNKKRVLNIYDKKGNRLESIEVPEVNDSYNFNSGDEKYMFVRYENESGAYLKYIDKSKIGTGTAKLETLFELEEKYLDTTLIR